MEEKVREERMVRGKNEREVMSGEAFVVKHQEQGVEEKVREERMVRGKNEREVMSGEAFVVKHQEQGVEESQIFEGFSKFREKL